MRVSSSILEGEITVKFQYQAGQYDSADCTDTLCFIRYVPVGVNSDKKTVGEHSGDWKELSQLSFERTDSGEVLDVCGMAIQDPRDTFSKSVGRKLALKRALDALSARICAPDSSAPGVAKLIAKTVRHEVWSTYFAVHVKEGVSVQC